MLTEYKTCTACLTPKLISDYYKSKDGRPIARCKPCHIAITGRWQKNNRHVNRAAGKKWRERHPLGEVNHRLKFHYGITLDRYNEMFADQAGLCLICAKPDPQGHRLAVDHCHVTCKVRGLLCKRCNSALYILEHKELMAAAEKYLKERS